MIIVNNRNIGIDLLRGICIIYIVGFWHLLNYTEAIQNYKNIITYRLTWVILATFVFVSGYFIGKNNIELHKQALISYYIKKIMRIYPLYLISVLVFTFFGLSDVKTTIKALLLVSMFVKPSPATLWFIAMVMFFYVISPFLVFACKNIKKLKIIAIYIIVSFLLMLYYHFTKLLDLRLIVYLPAFIFGIFVAVNDKQSISTKLVILAFFVGALISFFLNTPHRQLNMLFSTLLVTSASFFLFDVFRKMNFENTKIMASIVLLSYSSYCMYLFHRPIYINLKKLYFPSSHFLQLLYFVVIGLPCIFIFSLYLQKFYDKTNKMLTNHFHLDAQKTARRWSAALVTRYCVSKLGLIIRITPTSPHPVPDIALLWLSQSAGGPDRRKSHIERYDFVTAGFGRFNLREISIYKQLGYIIFRQWNYLVLPSPKSEVLQIQLFAIFWMFCKLRDRAHDRYVYTSPPLARLSYI